MYIISYIESREKLLGIWLFWNAPIPSHKNREQLPSLKQQVCTWKLSESQRAVHNSPENSDECPPKKRRSSILKISSSNQLIFMGYVSFWGCNSGSSIFFHWKKVWSWQLWGSKIFGKTWPKFSRRRKKSQPGPTAVGGDVEISETTEPENEPLEEEIPIKNHHF